MIKLAGLSDEEQNLRLMSATLHYHRWIYEQIAPHLIGQKILEVGAGVGNLTGFLLQACGDIVGTDVNETNLQELVARYAGVRTYLDDIASTHLDEQFDTVVCVNVLEHIRDDKAALLNLRRLLRGKGHLILLVPALQALYGTVDIADGHHRRYARQALQHKLQRAGFRVVEMKYMNLLGALGWWWDGRFCKKRVHRKQALWLFDHLVPLWKQLERWIRPPFGLSLVAVATPGDEDLSSPSVGSTDD